MLKNLNNLQDFVLIVFLIYFLPILVVLYFLTEKVSGHLSWPVFGVGLLLSTSGSFLIYSMLQSYTYSLEESFQLKTENNKEEVESEEIVEVQNSFYEAMENELSSLNQLLADNVETLEKQKALAADRLEELEKYKEKFEFQEKEYSILQEEFTKFKKLSEEKMELEQKRHQDAEETISTLRATVDSKQQKTEALENKIHDLSYEIKTLLQIADLSSFSSSKEQAIGSEPYDKAEVYQVPINTQEISYENDDFITMTVSTSEEAKRQLKRCLNIAQKITGAQHLSLNRSRFGDFSFDNYALNLRRLCDSLRSENSCTIFVFSPKENKLIFINNQVKELLGWSPEKFVMEFDDIVQDGIVEWKHSINQLNTLNHHHSRFVMKARSGKDMLLHCQIGLIPTGVFKNNVIGVLYPA